MFGQFKRELIKIHNMLSDKDILVLIKTKKLTIQPFSKKSIGCASVDLSLGDCFCKYTKTIDTHSNKTKLVFSKNNKIILKPNQFVLATTKEKVHLVNGYYGFIETRGNFSRAGISISCDDGHIDPGTNGQITLEIKNNNTVPVILYAGDYLCQLFVFKLSSLCKKIYSGKYQRQCIPTAFKI